MAFYSTGKTKFSQAEQINDNNPVKILGLNSSDVVVTSDPNNIKEWVAGTYSENTLVTKEINGQLYSFKSTADNNATEPLLFSEKEAWNEYFLGGTYIGVWNSSTTYNPGDILDREGYLYRCITTHSNSDPKQLIPANWFKIGINTGAFNPSTIYSNGEAIITNLNKVYVSNYDNNNYTLNYGIVSKWELINGQPNTIVSWGDSLTFGTGSTGTSDYPLQLSIASGVNINPQGVPGETSTQILTRFLADPELWKLPTIIWAGRNNYGDPTTVKSDIAAMVSKLTHGRYLVFGIIRANGESAGVIETLNDELEVIYGDRFIDVQSYLLSIYNQSIPQDIADHAAGKIAWSLHSDWVHLNNLGYYYVAKIALSKLNILLGQEYRYFTSLETGGVRVTGNSGATQDTVGIELGYRSDLNVGFIDAYNRKINQIIPINIGFVTNSEVRLIPNTGKFYLGDLTTPYTSGGVKRLTRLNSTGEIVYAPVIGNGIVPYENSNGNLVGSTLFYNTLSGELAVNTTTPETGFKFQTEGNVAFGTQGLARIYGGTLNSTRAYLQVRDINLAQDFQLFTKSLIISDSVDVSTGEKLQVNGTAKFTGEVTVPNATVSTSAVNLSQLNVVDNKVKYGATTVIMNGTDTVFNIPHGMGSTPLSFSISFGDASNLNFVQSNRSLTSTNIVITCDTPPLIGSQVVYWQVYK